ncbi:MAG TPA: hypothetical protein VMD52_04475 [Patescibacteria group bacterium]|nr:hypothetical protein [Patescibacteria group bacterium]
MSRKIYRFLSFLLCLSLIFQQSGFAQIAGQLNASACLLNLSNIIVADKFRPLHLRALSYDSAHNNFRLLLDKGDVKELKDDLVKDSTQKLMEYFFVGITLPNEAFWVNLRPDSENDIIDDELAKTDLGKVLLEADLQLKKDTARLTSPENPQGKLYWDKLYQKAEELLGQSDTNIPALVRPWIVPGEVIIRESQSSAYVYKATLKVMLEEDYLQGTAAYAFDDPRLKALNEYSSQLLRELILPQLTREINASKKYAALRQAYYSLILAQWFKSRFQLVNQKNLNQGLVSKVPWSKAAYFRAYQKSFQDGEYKIQDTIYTASGPGIRSYISGGMNLALPASSAVFTLQNNRPITASATTLAVGYDGSIMVSLAGKPAQSVSSSIDDAQASFPFMHEPDTAVYRALQQAQGRFTHTYANGKTQDFELTLREAPGRYNTQVVLRLPGSQEEAGYLELTTSEDNDTIEAGWLWRNKNYQGPSISVPLLSRLREALPVGKALHTTIGETISLRELMTGQDLHHKDQAGLQKSKIEYLKDTNIGEKIQAAGWQIDRVFYTDAEIGEAHAEPVREALTQDVPRDLRPGEQGLPQGWLHVWLKPVQDRTTQPMDYGIDDDGSQGASSSLTMIEQHIDVDAIARQLGIYRDNREAILNAFNDVARSEHAVRGYATIIHNEQLLARVVGGLNQFSSPKMSSYLWHVSLVLSELRDEGLAESIVDGLFQHPAYLVDQMFASGASTGYAFSFFSAFLQKFLPALYDRHIPVTPALVQSVFRLSDIDAVVYAKAFEYEHQYPGEIDQIIKGIVAASDVGTLQVRQAIADLLFVIDDSFFKTTVVHPEYNYQEDEPIGIFRDRKLFESQFLDTLPLPVESPSTPRQPLAQITSMQEFQDLFTPERGPGFRVEGERVIFLGDRAVRNFIARHQVDIVPPGEYAGLASRWTTDSLLAAAQDFYTGATAVLLSESGKLWFFKECSDNATAQEEQRKSPFNGTEGFKAFVVGRYYIATFALDYRPPTIKPERMRPAPYNRIAKTAQEAIDAARQRSLGSVTNDFASVHNLADTQLSNMLVKYTWNGTLIDVKVTDQIVSAEIKKKYDLRHSGLSFPGQASSTIEDFFHQGALGVGAATQAPKVVFSQQLSEDQVGLLKNGGEVRRTPEGGLAIIETTQEERARPTYKPWPIFGTHFDEIDTIFKGLFQESLVQKIINLAQSHPENPVYILDWGAGNGLAAIELAEKLKNYNVRIIAFGNTYVPEFMPNTIPPNVLFLIGEAGDLVRDLKGMLPAGTKLDAIISYAGIHGLLTEADRGRGFLTRVAELDTLLSSNGFMALQVAFPHRIQLLKELTPALEAQTSLQLKLREDQGPEKTNNFVLLEKKNQDLRAGSPSASSPTGIVPQTQGEVGGIDFRSLPIPAQSPTFTFTLRQPVQLIPSAKLGEYWQDIQKSLQDNAIPSSDRILNYLRSCCDKEDAAQEIEKIVACIAEILRLEEDQVVYTDPEMKQILAVLESQISLPELRAALFRLDATP